MGELHAAVAADRDQACFFRRHKRGDVDDLGGGPDGRSRAEKRRARRARQPLDPRPHERAEIIRNG